MFGGLRAMAFCRKSILSGSVSFRIQFVPSNLPQVFRIEIFFFRNFMKHSVFDQKHHLSAYERLILTLFRKTAGRQKKSTAANKHRGGGTALSGSFPEAGKSVGLHKFIAFFQAHIIHKVADLLLVFFAAHQQHPLRLHHNIAVEALQYGNFIVGNVHQRILALV